MPLITIARTGDGFSSFGPYVASVNEAGVVAFHAARPDGTTTIRLANGRDLWTAPLPDDVAAITSHPDITDDGSISVYGTSRDGGDRVYLIDPEGGVLFAHAAGHVGPAGPTMNASGAVAFRAERRAGRAGIYVGDPSGVRVVAEVGDRFTAFHGLPLIDANGDVVFRADRDDGVQGIYREGVPLAETGEDLGAIAPFPSAAPDGTIVFAGVTARGEAGVFSLRDGALTLHPGGEAFAAHRGALAAGASLIRIATPHGGGLGLFRGPDPASDRIVEVGQPVLGSLVVDLAANAVSVDRSGRLAIWVALADGREAILLADGG